MSYFGMRNARIIYTFFAQMEFARNKERYQFLKWGMNAFHNFRIVPPASGIVHQVNLEYLARVVFENAQGILYPDSVLGTDSHTTMVLRVCGSYSHVQYINIIFDNMNA